VYCISATISHLQVLNSFKYSDYSNVLIFEDDVYFTENYQEKLKLFMNNVPADWDILNLGKNYTFKPEQINCLSEHISVLKSVYGAHSYAFSKNKIQLTGLLDINFDGDSIDNFMGYAKFYNGQLKGEQSVVRFDSITLQSSIEKGIKNLRLASDDINASISGKFNIYHLPASIQFFMQRYLPSYIPAPSNTPDNQLFDIQIKTNYIEPFIRIFNSSFSGFNNLNLKGAINTDNKTLKFNVTVPFAQWQDMAFKGGEFTGNGNKDSIRLLIKAASYQLTDSFNFVDPIINIHTANDKSNIQITATSNNALQNINLAGTVNTYSNGLAIQWQPSYFLLNQKRWDINNGGEISLRKNNIFAKGVKFSQGLQELLLTSAKDNNLQLALNDIILGDITKLFFRYPQLEGITNGNVYLKNILDNFELTSDVTIDQFSFNNELLGWTNLNASYNHKTGIVPFSFDIPNKAYNISAEGSYNTKDSINPLDATLYLNHSKFSLVEQFISGVLTNLDGKADGKIHFGGRIENPVLLGSAKIEDASLKVDYTKVRYFIKEATIQFTNQGMDFGNIQLTDQLNRKALFKGKILNEGFKHLTYDLEMSSPKIERTPV
jgi:GR25 family glycosyltransferase involved in LPS biosynthesis